MSTSSVQILNTLTDGTQQTKILDDAGTGLTSTLVGSDQALDVNIVGGGGSGTQDNDDGSIASGQTSGISIALNHGYNGASWERLNSTSGALNVNVASGGSGDGTILDGVTSTIKVTVLDNIATQPLSTDNPLLTKTILTNGTYDVEVDSSNRLLVVTPPVTAPPGTTEISDFISGSVADGATVNTDTTIGNGILFTIQQFKSGSARDVEGIGSIQRLIWDPVGDNVLLAEHFTGDSNFVTPLNFTTTGNGIKVLRIQRDNSDGADPKDINGGWDGFTTP